MNHAVFRQPIPEVGKEHHHCISIYIHELCRHKNPPTLLYYTLWIMLLLVERKSDRLLASVCVITLLGNPHFHNLKSDSFLMLRNSVALKAGLCIHFIKHLNQITNLHLTFPSGITTILTSLSHCYLSTTSFV